MKHLLSLSTALLLASTAAAESKIFAEAGVSYFALRGADFDGPNVLSASGGRNEVAPFVAAGYRFTETFALRLSYHHVNEIASTVQYGYPPATGGDVNIPMVVWGEHRDRVHVVGLAPELRWTLGDRLSATVSPALNWVASSGGVRYWTNSPAITIIPWRPHDDDALTFGGSLGLAYSLSERTGLSIAYQYADLDPSWGREAHIFSGALRLNF